MWVDVEAVGMSGLGLVLDFSVGSVHLCLRNRQLLVRRNDGADAPHSGLSQWNERDPTIPIEDIAVVLLSSRRATTSVAALDALASAGAAVVVCGPDMLPTGMLLPLAGHFEHTKRLAAQLDAPLPLRKRVWQEIVRAKVLSQGSLLETFRGDALGMYELADKVRSGDPENIEARAAQRYWPALMGSSDFRRRVDADGANSLLNYGYAVLRASVARSICAAGLHPAVGVHHHGRGNPFCLADDLMEPYRPVIDGVAAVIADETPKVVPTLDPRNKARLVGVLQEGMEHRDRREVQVRPVMDWISRSAASLARRLCRETDESVFFPSGLVNP